MKTEPTDANRPRNAKRLQATTLFELLADDRRRQTLDYLEHKVGAILIGELAEQIAIWEGDPTMDHYERILTDLYHSHLPKLAEAGLLRYEIESETVTLLDAAEQCVPHLELVRDTR